ncbi:Gfo/Idh/MocA family oxidoreductase [bacterium]|nr:Gfo/Idh/MocA family oxidoreductase [bacterium]
MSPVKFAIVGVGGYAVEYHDAIAQLEKNGTGKLVAVAEWNQEMYSEKLAQLSADGVKVFKDYTEMLDVCGDDLDFVGLPVGIHLHAPMTIQALEKGLNVVCEKPVAATIQDVDAMMAKRDELKKIVMIGYQEISTDSIQRIKNEIVKGDLGRVLAVKVKGGWPRGSSYYSRNRWGGKVKVGDTWVLDGPANNAMAHYLNNMLFVASTEPEKSAKPVAVQAELYRANDIDTYDTISLRARLDNGVSLLFVASHASETVFNPEMTIQCELGTVIRDMAGGQTTIEYFSGRRETFNDLSFNSRHRVFETAVSLFHGETKPYCSLEIGRSQTLTINGAHESCPEITPIPVSEIETEALETELGQDASDTRKIVKGIDHMIEDAYVLGKTFSEINVSWAKSSPEFKLENYTHFPQKG